MWVGNMGRTKQLHYTHTHTSQLLPSGRFPLCSAAVMITTVCRTTTRLRTSVSRQKPQGAVPAGCMPRLGWHGMSVPQTTLCGKTKCCSAAYPRQRPPPSHSLLAQLGKPMGLGLNGGGRKQAKQRNGMINVDGAGLPAYTHNLPSPLHAARFNCMLQLAYYYINRHPCGQSVYL